MRIARSRRRIDRHLEKSVDRALLFGSWREFVREHPIRSLLAATGLGMLLSFVAPQGGLLNRVVSMLGEFAKESSCGFPFRQLKAMMNWPTAEGAEDEFDEAPSSAEGARE